MISLKKEQFEKILLAGIVIAGLIYSYVIYLFLPQRANLQIQSQELAKREAYYVRLEEVQSNLPQLQKEAQDLELELKRQSTQMPVKLDKAQLLVELYALAKQKGMSPQSLTFDNVQDKESYQEFDMTFTGEGSAASILNFLQELQHGSALQVAVRGVNLTTQKGVMKAELKLAAYGSLNSNLTPGDKPVFMNSPFGVDSPAKMFTP